MTVSLRSPRVGDPFTESCRIAVCGCQIIAGERLAPSEIAVIAGMCVIHVSDAPAPSQRHSLRRFDIKRFIGRRYLVSRRRPLPPFSLQISRQQIPFLTNTRVTRMSRLSLRGDFLYVFRHLPFLRYSFSTPISLFDIISDPTRNLAARISHSHHPLLRRTNREAI